MTLILNGSVGVSDVDGSAATPAIRGTDANTGMFFPAADTIAFAEGGVEAMRIDSSGNVGIGTTTITQKLTVSGSTSASNYYLGVAAGTYGIASDTSIEMYGASSSQVMLFKVNGNTERMRIDSSGNVGIGTSTPSQKLTISDATAANILLSGSTTNFVTYAYSGFAVSGTTSNTPWLLYTNNTERARIDASGNWYMNSGYGSVAVAYGCRAWVRYDGNAQSLIASGNVSSVTYTGTGNYYVNLSTAMPDANYSISLGRCTLNATQPGADGTLMVGLSSATANWIGTADQATTGFRLRFGTSGSSFFNTSYVSAAIFR